MGSSQKIVLYFQNRGGGGGDGGSGITTCEISVAIDFGLENQTFFAKSDIFIPNCGGVHLFKK